MRSQDHKRREQGVDSRGFRGHETTASVTGGAPSDTGIALIPTGFAAGTIVGVKFTEVPNVAEGVLDYNLAAGAFTDFPVNAWVPVASFDNVRFTQGTALGTFHYRYLLEYSDGNVYECVLTVTSAA